MTIKKLFISIVLAATLANPVLAQELATQPEEQTTITKADVLKKTLKIGMAAAETAAGAFMARALYVTFYQNKNMKNDLIDSIHAIVPKQKNGTTREDVEKLINKFIPAAAIAYLALFAHGAHGLYQELKPIAKQVYKKVKAEKPEQL